MYVIIKFENVQQLQLVQRKIRTKQHTQYTSNSYFFICELLFASILVVLISYHSRLPNCNFVGTLNKFNGMELLA